ncbi:carboxylesterase family protein [Streptomyces sp. NPDC047002]|uniref:carboxylesterase/lipase family protein n=1 Tax=Streptomyces sp. NPDC047002 TaxID=3155475 RepID=UPI003452541A
MRERAGERDRSARGGRGRPWHRRAPGAALAAAAVLLTAAGCGGGGGTGGSGGASPAASAAPTTVTTSSGTYQGVQRGGVREFLGIRYAQAPTGAHRWTLPRAATAPQGVRHADKPGPRCAQSAAAPGAKPTLSEDCLFLNVTAPRDLRKGEKLPVMVWWHGGGYTSGAGSDYDAQRLADDGHVMVVTANYRLGVFGYLGLPGLEGSGDFGLADQVQSLRWTKANAARFGGDPDNVTVFGQSAGAMSACALLTSPSARGLVDKAVVMSGSCALTWPAGTLFPGAPAQTPYTRLATGQADGAAAAKRLGCTGSGALDCLRRLPAATLVPLNQEFSDHLAYGTPLLPKSPAEAVRAGDVAKVPVVSGGTRDEARSFIGGAMKAAPKAVTAKTYPALLRTAFGSHAAEVQRAYPLSRFGGSAGLAWSTVSTDAAWSCPTRSANAELAKHTSVYAYEFADEHAPDVNGVGDPGFPLGAAHASDLPYLFDLGGKNLLHSSGQQQLSDKMIASWASFARTGKPAAPDTPWSASLAAQGKALALAPGGIAPVDTGSEHHCALWAGITG